MGLGHDKAKIDVIAKLPHPTTIKGVWSFLDHAGFYRRFIKDFSKISRPMTYLLEKNTRFIFSNECIHAFETLNKKLTEAPILIAPDWDLPFELMYDASDFAICAVLGQRHEKHFRPIHYASKTMNEAESHYTTTEKEMLAVVDPRVFSGQEAVDISQLPYVDHQGHYRCQLHAKNRDGYCKYHKKRAKTRQKQTREGKSAQEPGVSSKEAQDWPMKGLPRWQSVCFNFDPRAKKGYPMIGND
ncbi:reverse transcriptase domain-containing protein [Tanacetum coccineum]